MFFKRFALWTMIPMLLATASARPPRPPQPDGENFNFPRGGRGAQSIQSIEFNGITVLHEDLIHSMSPVQEKLDVTRSGIHVSVRFQFDEVVIHPKAKSGSQARISVVHNETDVEIVKVPMHHSRSELRGNLQFDPKTRHRLRKDCANSTCMIQVTVGTRMFGRSSVVELGKLKFFKKSNNKTGIKLLTYPRLLDKFDKDSSWDPLGWAWVGGFHFFLVLGSALLVIVGVEAKRTYGLLKIDDAKTAASKRWLQLTFTCVLLFLGMSVCRALDIVSMSEIVYAAPTAAVVGVASFCFAGAPEEEFIQDDQDYDKTEPPFSDEEDTQEKTDAVSEAEEPKKTK